MFTFNKYLFCNKNIYLGLFKKILLRFRKFFLQYANINLTHVWDFRYCRVYLESFLKMCLSL